MIIGFRGLISSIFIFSFFNLLFPVITHAAPSINSINQSGSSVSLYDKFEVAFNITGSVAENLQWPYDPDSIAGLTTRVGITVDGLFLPPGESNWSNAMIVPAFLFQPVIIDRSVTSSNANSE